MRRVINSTYMSLDGVVQRPELWTFDYRSEDAARYSHDLLFGSDALLMGRHTYDIFASHWPTATDDTGFADRMNNLPKYVVSNTLAAPTWNNTTVVAPDSLPDLIRQLKQQPGQDVLQYGYGVVTATLLREGLLDELRLWLHPLLVGGGDLDALLARVGSKARFRLTDMKRYQSDLLILSYQIDASPANASAPE